MASSPLAQTQSRRRLRVLPAPLTDRYSVGGVGVNVLRFRDALDLLLDAPANGQRLRVHFAAVHTIVEAARDPDLMETLNEADVISPDGMPLVWLGRLGGHKVERVCGPDTMLALLDRSRENGSSHFFYGGSPEVAESLAQAMTERFPGLKVAGVYSPPYRSLSFNEVEEVTDMINKAAPDYVWVGLGSPKQDHWLASFRPLLNAPVLLGVGAAFDFHAGKRKRAPEWAQRWGVEWLFRLCSEPQRLAWRYSVMSLRFAWLLLNDKNRRSPVLEDV